MKQFSYDEFVIQMMTRVIRRLESIDQDDLLSLVSIERIATVVGVTITGPDDVTDELITGPLRGFAAVATFLQKSEEALAAGHNNECLEDEILVFANEDDAAALFLWGGILARAIDGFTSALGYVNESGSCPNGTENCPVNGFSDAVYAMAVKAGERHDFNIPDLGVSEHRFDDGLQDYLAARKASSLIRMIGRVPTNAFGGGWGITTAEG